MTFFGTGRLGTGASQLGRFRLGVVEETAVSPAASFTADAVIFRTQQTSFTANAVIFRPGQPSVADDMEIAFEDHFERVNVSSWGDLYPAAPLGITGASIDGSVGQVSDLLDAVSPYGPVNGSVEFDFFVPADVTDITGRYYIETGDVIGGLNYYASYLSLFSNGDGSWTIESLGTSETFTPAASSWYTAKLLFYPRLGLERTKVWLTGSAEPDWLGVGAAPSPVGTATVSSIISSRLTVTAFAAENAQFDNFIVRSFQTVILYDLFTDLTDDVQLEGATFTSAVNGRGGEAAMQVRDLAHTHDFILGRELALELFGRRYWTGFVLDAPRGYYFTSTDKDAAETPRFIQLKGVDLNVLFAKRVLYNKTNPTQPLTNFATGTSDREVLLTYLTTHVDLADDVLDLDTFIESVGTPNTDGAIFGNPSETLGSFMEYVRRDVGSIYYIDPYRRFRYSDAETLATSGEHVLGITDHPLTEAEIGCHDLIMEYDAKDMVNDALVWGAGQGSATMAFSRVIDTASKDEHGRWQEGQFLRTVFRQTSTDRIANSMVYGSPQSLRGGKDDAVSVRCIVHTHRFLPADKVPIRSEVHDLDRVLPVRSVNVNWKSDVPIFSLVLSHDIDQPWQTFEYWFPTPDWEVPRLPDLPGLPSPSRFGDNYNRIESSSWGTPSNLDGEPWVFIPFISGGSGIAVDGSRGIIHQFSDPDGGQTSTMTTPATFWRAGSISLQFLFKLTDDVTSMLMDISGGSSIFSLRAGTDGSVGSPLFLRAFVSDGIENITVDSPNVASWINQYIYGAVFIDGDTVSVQLWNSGTVPPGWTTDTNPSMNFDATGTTDLTVQFSSETQLTDPYYLYLDYIDILLGGAIENPNSGDPQAGYTCQVMTDGFTPPGYPPGNYFRAATTFTSGSTRVWVDGIHLRRNVDYYEGDPYYGGFIHIMDWIDTTGKVVYMCYTANPQLAGH